MEHLQHDPRTKQLVKDTLFDFLYSHVQEEMKTRLDTIIVKNTLLGGYGHKSFFYKGVLYQCDSTRPPIKRNLLLPQLRTLMDDYIKDVKQLNEEELPYVLGFINQVLNSSNDFQDYLRLFPNAVHHPLERLALSCPYRTKQLSDDSVETLRKKNQKSIELMKKRMVLNLIT